MGQPGMARVMSPAHTYLNGEDMYYLYLLQRVDANEYYLGSTSDLRRRVKEHNDGKGCRTTKGYQWRVKYYEAYETLEEARRRERQLKRNRGSKRALYQRLGITFE